MERFGTIEEVDVNDEEDDKEGGERHQAERGSGMIKAPKKLIEVALPLDDINRAAARGKSIRHGHPSTLHLWWARRPLAAAQAVIFAQMVNDPGYERSLGRGVNKELPGFDPDKLSKGCSVTVSILARICAELGYDQGDIMRIDKSVNETEAVK